MTPSFSEKFNIEIISSTNRVSHLIAFCFALNARLSTIHYPRLAFLSFWKMHNNTPSFIALRYWVISNICINAKNKIRVEYFERKIKNANLSLIRNVKLKITTLLNCDLFG